MYVRTYTCTKCNLHVHVYNVQLAETATKVDNTLIFTNTGYPLHNCSQ